MKKGFFMIAAMCLACMMILFHPITAEAYQERVNAYVPSVLNYDFANEVVDRVNQERAAQGIAPLTLDSGLMETAMLRSTEQFISYSHTRPNGEKCFTAFPYQRGYRAENICYGSTTPEGAMIQWMNSAPHRESILNGIYNSIGVGCAYDSEADCYYWTQCFSSDAGDGAKRYGTESRNYNIDAQILIPDSMPDIRIDGTDTNSIELRWDYVSHATSFEIEQYISGSWIRIGTEDALTNYYKADSLSPGTTYQFRIRAIKDFYQYHYTTDYSYVTGTTTGSPAPEKPEKVQGLKITKRTAKSLSLKWTKHSNADGYILQQYKGGEWKRIANISDSDTVTYVVSGLKSATSYSFRVKAYIYNGDTTVSGGWTTVKGKTNPVAVSGLKIAGRTSNTLRLNWTKNSKASGYIIQQYKSGKWTQVAKITNNATVTYRASNLKASTTYKFRIKAYAYDGKTMLSSVWKTISGKTQAPASTQTLTAVSGLKIGGRATDAIRLNWNKNNTASGYIVEQYKSGKWTRVASIGKNSTVTYRVEKLASGTKYAFRVKTFQTKNGKAIYSAYKKISGKTLPAEVTGLKIGGRAKDAIRLNWNRNSKASGYIVEQYVNGKWVRKARIASNSTVTCRIAKLKTKTTYVYRVRCFDFDGETPIYGPYKYISGITR